jgi:SAM-dependent methyltransferase
MGSESLYDSYIKFKNWDLPSDSGYDDNAAMFKQASLSGKLNVLEIGCGAGSFMEWARVNGHTIEGIELIPELVEAGSKRGFVIHQAPVGKEAFEPHSFDVVVAIDVLEHLSLEHLQETLRLARAILKPNGKLIARFPNGASPFSARWQNGDWTHTKPLSASSLGQIAIPTGMVVDAVFNPRSFPPGIARGIRRRAVYAIRDVIEIAMGYIYYGDRHPMDPNVIVVLTPAVD